MLCNFLQHRFAYVNNGWLNNLIYIYMDYPQKYGKCKLCR